MAKNNGAFGWKQRAEAAASTIASLKEAIEHLQERVSALGELDSLRDKLRHAKADAAKDREVYEQHLSSVRYNLSCTQRDLESAQSLLRITQREFDKLKAQDSDAASLRKRLQKKSEELVKAYAEIARLKAPKKDVFAA